MVCLVVSRMVYCIGDWYNGDYFGLELEMDVKLFGILFI